MRVTIVPLLLVALAGCATITPRQPEIHDAHLRTERMEVTLKEGAHATVDQRDTAITIGAARSCDLVERPIVRRTTTTRFENQSGTSDWLLGGAGVAFAGLGVATVVDASAVAPTDRSGQNYNPLGQGGATALGIGSIAAGAGLLGIAIVDVIRANRVDVRDSDERLDGSPVKKGIRCSNEPYADATVALKYGERAAALGKTDARGVLTADLDSGVDQALILPLSGATATVLVEEYDVGTVNLSPLAKKREDATWRTLSVPECEDPATQRACDGLIAHVRNYPDGPHAAEARAAVERAKPKLRKRADEEFWHTAQSSIPSCVGKTEADPDAIDAACATLADYVRQFPDGAQVKTAEEAQRAGKSRAAALRAEIERKQRAEEQAERRREAAEAARAKAAHRERCQSQCLVMCSRRLNEGSCLAGCIPLCVSQGPQ